MKSIYIIIIFTLFACTNRNEYAERSKKEFTILSDSIESIMPGKLLVYADYIIWTDPFTIEEHVHILDKVTGKEISKIVKIGEGPEEFITPSVEYAQNNRLFVFDLNLEKVAYYPLDNIFSSNIQFTRLENQGETRYFELTEGQLLSFNPSLEKPFKWNNKYWGKLAFDQSIKNNESVSQGNVLYNPYSKYIVYSCMSYPYLSLYQMKNDEIVFISEKKRDFDYNIVKGELKIDRKRRGAAEMALTSDYIITLERDYKTDDTDESTVGRDFNKLPHTIFLYDYSLNLKKILDLGIPLLRLAADPKNNTLYAIGVDPDFILIKCDL